MSANLPLCDHSIALHLGHCLGGLAKVVLVPHPQSTALNLDFDYGGRRYQPSRIRYTFLLKRRSMFGCSLLFALLPLFSSLVPVTRLFDTGDFLFPLWLGGITALTHRQVNVP